MSTHESIYKYSHIPLKNVSETDGLTLLGTIVISENFKKSYVKLFVVYVDSDIFFILFLSAYGETIFFF